MSSSIPISRKAGPNDAQSRRGQLKVFLGYAAGVGKTYRMLEEAQQLKAQGKDIVVGYFEPHERKISRHGYKCHPCAAPCHLRCR
jgi:K+-sensing histidine kinase KdpD